MTTISNSFESPASGTTLTSGNSSNADGSTAFDSVTVGTGGTLATSTTHVIHGSQSLKAGSGSTAALTYAQWLGSGPFAGNPGTIWGRVYCYLTANPSASFKIIQVIEPSTGTVGAVAINTSGKLVGSDGAGTVQTTSTPSIPLNAWFRVEFKMTASPTVGVVEVKLFTTVEGTSPADTKTATGLNTGSTTTIGGARIGQVTANANAGPGWFDDLAFSDVGYLGPSTASVALTGPVSTVSVSAPAGAVAIGYHAAGVVATVPVSAPAGSVTFPRTLGGPVVTVAVSVHPGTFSQTSLAGQALTVNVVTPAGQVLASQGLSAASAVIAVLTPAGAVKQVRIFTPPTEKLRPVDPQGERLWLYYGIDTGISVIKNQDGSYTPTTYPTTDDFATAAFVYLGGHEYEVDDAEYAALVAAGYLPGFVGANDEDYGSGDYGVGPYGG